MYRYKHQRSTPNPLPKAERVCRCYHTLASAWYLYAFCSRYADWSQGRHHLHRHRRHRQRRQVWRSSCWQSHGVYACPFLRHTGERWMRSVIKGSGVAYSDMALYNVVNVTGAILVEFQMVTGTFLWRCGVGVEKADE